MGCEATSNPKLPLSSVDLSYTSLDPDYGFTEGKPLMLGGFMRGSPYEGAHIEYFDSLLGPQGQRVVVKRLGSCCGFEDASMPFGGGMLDMYEVTYKGQKKPVVIYVNLYRFEKPLAPVGFVLL